MLLDPFTFRNGVRARNRLWLAPMTTEQCFEDGRLSEEELRWLAMRAAGGFGVVETCAAHVALDGQGFPGALGIHDDRLLPGLTRLAEVLRRREALGIVQLFHAGMRVPLPLIGHQGWSATSQVEGGVEIARAAIEADITRVVDQFRRAALRASAAGFAGVELHAAHGYLLCQFLSATINTRTDRWGGTLEGRARLLRATARAVRAAVPSRFVVGVRLSPEDYGAAQGLDLDESLQIAGWLCDDGIDFLHLSLWEADANTTKRPYEHPIPLFRRALVPQVPLVVAGGVWTRADAEDLVAKGASAVALGRAAILNAEWPRHAGDASWRPQRPPVTKLELEQLGVSGRFARFLERWEGFVAPDKNTD
jgi:2,4-dienoyl-CoA reductase-like NADH-dependent reductase (Old Yellow Enzyme family)